MALRLTGHIDLPAHAAPGGFDHAAIHERTRRLYVAHTANDAVDVIDCTRGVFTHSIGGLPGVAGVFVDGARDLAFTSNRAEDTVSVFHPEAEGKIVKVGVGVHPNGLAFDSRRGTLRAANVGDPASRSRIAETYEVPAAGPHGLELDVDGGRLFCACDEGQLVALDAATGRVLGTVALSGTPDVIFLDPALGRLYVAVGDPGVIDVIDVRAMRRLEIVPTEPGAHTTALDGRRHRLYVFLPGTHRAAVFVDG